MRFATKIAMATAGAKGSVGRGFYQGILCGDLSPASAKATARQARDMTFGAREFSFVYFVYFLVRPFDLP